tara:strand:+ start:38 stop:760 length:723 start_codon:yes stop_codon:yes gene_type:complete
MSSKIRLYFSGKIKSTLVSHLTNEQTHYVKDVMRLKTGGNLSVFNSSGEWNAVIESYEKDRARIKVLEQTKDQENEKNIWLAFSLIKQNPLNFIIQKGTELGVQKFLPILSTRSIVKEINIKRIQKIIVESSEQSNRISIPEIKKIEKLKTFLSQFPKDGCLIFCDINHSQNNLKNILSKKISGPVCILIGPEGDFSETERQLILDLPQANSITLSKNILRAETAALAAVTIVNHYLNLS